MSYTKEQLFDDADVMLGDYEVTNSIGRPEYNALLPEAIKLTFNRAFRDDPDYFMRTKSFSATTSISKNTNHYKHAVIQITDADCKAGGVRLYPPFEFDSASLNTRRQGTLANPIGTEQGNVFTIAPARTGVLWYYADINETEYVSESTDFELLFPVQYMDFLLQNLVNLALRRALRDQALPDMFEDEMKEMHEVYDEWSAFMHYLAQDKIVIPSPMIIPAMQAQSEIQGK